MSVSAVFLAGVFLVAVVSAFLAAGAFFADAFLADGDHHVRFFGALTFTVKLNNDGSVVRTLS